MKITKRQLRRIIREERARMICESPSVGLIPGIGFAGSSTNSNPNFARAYHGTYADSPAALAMKKNQRYPRVEEVGGLGGLAPGQLTYGQEIEGLTYLLNSKYIDYELGAGEGEFILDIGELEGITIKVMRHGR